MLSTQPTQCSRAYLIKGFGCTMEWLVYFFLTRQVSKKDPGLFPAHSCLQSTFSFFPYVFLLCFPVSTFSVYFHHQTLCVCVLSLFCRYSNSVPSSSLLPFRLVFLKKLSFMVIFQYYYTCAHLWTSFHTSTISLSTIISRNIKNDLSTSSLFICFLLSYRISWQR